MYIGMHSTTLGRYRDALANLDAAHACFVRDGQIVWTAVASNHKASVLLDLGQPGRALKMLEYASSSIDSVWARREALAGRVERLLGRSGATLVEKALALLGEAGDPYMRMLVQMDHALSLPPPQAVACCEAVQRMAEELEYLGIAAKARLMRARHLLRLGDVQTAHLRFARLAGASDGRAASRHVSGRSLVDRVRSVQHRR
jgi:hypothetical protein